MNQGRSSIAAIGGAPTAQGTLAERLSRALDHIDSQVERIERMYVRASAGNEAHPQPSPDKVSPSRLLATSVENAEGMAQRLGRLAENLESIA